MKRIEIIDVGTVSVRMGIADVDAGQISTFTKKVQVCDLGEGLDATGRLAPAAIERVVACVAGYMGCFRRNRCDAVVCALTQSAREATNAGELLRSLRELGLSPQVVDGKTEGLLAAFGAMADFAPGAAGGARTLVADSGGGSTELSLLAQDDGDGSTVLGDGDHPVKPQVDGLAAAARKDSRTVPIVYGGWVVSTPVGSRRVAERFLAAGDPPGPKAVREARAWCLGQFTLALDDCPDLARATELVVCGGASTTLAAVNLELERYNPTLVHGSVLSLAEVDAMAARFAALPVAEIAEVPGVHPKRAPVALAAALICAALMEAVGIGQMRVSEADNLQGLALIAAAELEGRPSPLGWAPELALA